MTENKHLLISPFMKLADILINNSSLLSVLPRFGIHLGFGEKSLSEVCRKYDVNEPFFVLVCNIYTFREYCPQKEDLSGMDVGALLSYLQRSHTYYKEDGICRIENKLEQMKSDCLDSHYRIIRTFFDEYKKEVVAHFQYEDEQVFPYIKELVDGRVRADFKIDQYEQNHSNIEDKLSDLKNIVIKYLPESCSSARRNELLFDVFLFEDELNRHSLIEDKVLIPYVCQMEDRV